ncbi:MAG: hypothetical protein GWM98_26885 [Nitrospinaceae bacterium]|nr:hypothetical protein [Nitrospinaceae bacterium]NIR57422.1 hypothetical protein [Nitrospinaceae bacterium]NIS87880.1 hypothetical protein [Nitrospinaceae bacterium]NIT84750.1 hypothetical protein [Nitrospinaceae bacterium]NIU46925.1 hypothetical protein [Nitrospinaceae bacterium]
MEPLFCPECGREIGTQTEQCPHCGKKIISTLPKYPTFGGPRVFLLIWTLFLLLIVGLLVTMFTTQR